MSDLVEGIEAEARGDYGEALNHYSRLVGTSSGVDHVGVCQALARCLERLGRFREAGRWRREAGQGYLSLNDAELARNERLYLALQEYRLAVQDLREDPALPEVAKEYAAVLRENFSEGAEGLTHEGLFAGAFFQSLGDHLAAAKYFFDTAEALSEQAAARNDGSLRAAAIRAYERAGELANQAGRPDVTRVAQLRVHDLRQVA